jgi:transposase
LPNDVRPAGDGRVEAKGQSYSKQIIEIADYLYRYPTKKMSEVLSYYVGKCRKNSRTIERYIRKAKEYNIAREKQAVGRPSVYRQEYNEQVFKLCLLGAMDKEIADFFDVSEQTINAWKKQHPQFLESIKRGKQQADANVAASLYKCALGFVKDDCEEVFQHKGEIVRAKVKKYYPPSVTAQIFLLKNRQPKLWRDKQTQVLENPDGTPIIAKDYKVTLEI